MLGAILGGAIGLGGNLIGGLLQSKAANKAAEAQRVAATEAKDLIGVQLGEAQRPIADATANAQNVVGTAANYAIDTAGAGANRALDTASRANSLYETYSTAGGTAANYLNGAVAEGGAFNKPVTMADLQMDPGFAWRLQQGQTALERSAAAKGGLLSGEALKALAGYSQGLASQEYQNAFDRYQTDTAQRYARLFGTAGMGMDASGQQANNLNTAARYAGDLNMQGAGLNLNAQQQVGQFGLQGAGMLSDNTMRAASQQADIITGRGNAEAASKVAQGNVWGNAVAGGANSIGSAMIYKDLMKNPAVKR